MHEVTVLHGDTWLLENAACLLLECGADMIENLLMSRVLSKKVADIGAWIAALSVAVVHLGDSRYNRVAHGLLAFGAFYSFLVFSSFHLFSKF